MAKKGETARAVVTNTIAEAFAITGNLVGIVDKKIYVTADDGGEMLQFAISITMPKTPIAAGEVGSASTQVKSSDGAALPQIATAPQPIELSEDDKAAVAKLMEQLGITD